MAFIPAARTKLVRRVLDSRQVRGGHVLGNAVLGWKWNKESEGRRVCTLLARRLEAALGPLGAHGEPKVPHRYPGQNLLGERSLHELFLCQGAGRLWQVIESASVRVSARVPIPAREKRGGCLVTYPQETFEIYTAGVQSPVKMVYRIFDGIVFRDKID